MMFLLFAGENYYAKGGMNDYIATFKTKDDAVQQGQLLVRAMNSCYRSIEWWHVVEIGEGGYIEMVARTKCTPHGNDNDDDNYLGEIYE